MNEKEFERALMMTLAEAPDDYKTDEALNIEQVRSVRTFEDVGVLTGNRGVVVTLTDGSEFQLTVVQSRQARD